METPAGAELSELVAAAVNLPNASVELGRVELLPRELQHVMQSRGYAARRQGTRQGQQGSTYQPSDARAHYLLAGSGFNAEQVLAEIAQVAAQESANSKTSGQKAHRRQHRTAGSKESAPSLLTGSIDTAVDGVMQDFGKRLNAELNSDWIHRKRRIFEMIGILEPKSSVKPDKVAPGSSGAGGNTNAAIKRAKAADSTSTSGFGDQSFARWGIRHQRQGAQILGEPETLPDPGQAQISGDKSSQAAWQRVRDFAQVISELNDSRARSAPFPLVKRLGDVARKHDPGTSTQLVDTWDLLYLVTKPSASSTGATDVVSRARNWLELQYRDYIDSEIAAHRSDARLGGIPSAYAKIKAFVHLKHTSKSGQWDDTLTLVNKTPIWAQLYYMVRAGYVKEALQVVLERSDIFELMGSTFAAVFKVFIQSPNGELSPQYAELVYSEYTQGLSSGGVDPYKQALYKIMGRCDLQHRSLPQVATTTEDWLWLQLMLVRPANVAEFGTDRFDLADLQESVLRIGAEYFDPHNTDPGKWFNVLMTVGLYDEGLIYLLDHVAKDPWAETCAVHYAIALAYHGLNLGKLPYAKVVGRYTRWFRDVLPTAAVDYLVTLVLVPEPDAKTACYEALQELVLETRQFSELLGDVDPSTEQSYSGAIERRMELIGLTTKRAYLRSIAHEAAAKADADGRSLDAILLYRLAGEPDRVLVMVNTALSQTLASVTVGQPVSSVAAVATATSASATTGAVPSSVTEPVDIVQLARNLMRLDSMERARPEARNTTLILLTTADALNLLADGDYDGCLERLGETGLVALSPDADVAYVRELAQQFTRHDDAVARTVPTVLLAAMTSCIRVVESLKVSGNPASATIISQYRQRAANCMIYAGLIQYRMSREAYSRLTQLEALLE